MLKTMSKSNFKQINWTLQKHFFSINELNLMSYRKAYKVIKLIAKLEGLNLKRKELKVILSAIRGNVLIASTSVVSIISNLFTFLKNKDTSNDKVVSKVYSLILSIVFVFNFRKERLEVLRI